jgi:hypothetical protein
MLVFGLVLASCGDDGGSDPTHKLEYDLSGGGVLTIEGDGESSEPKNGDSFTLVVNGGTITGTIVVDEGGTINFKKGDTTVFPPATITGGGDNPSIDIGAGDITFDNGSTGTQSDETVERRLYCDLYWGFMGDARYSQVKAGAAAEGISFTEPSYNSGYLTGANATAVYNKTTSDYSEYFIDNGELSNQLFEDLLNFNENGIGLPSALQTALRTEKANLPIVAAFEAQGGVVMFYVVKH